MKKKFEISMIINIIVAEILSAINELVIELNTEWKIFGMLIGLVGAIQLGVWFWHKFVEPDFK